MKRKNQKLLLFALVGFSLFSFVYVNSHAYLVVNPTLPQTEMLQKEASEDEKEQETKFVIPDLTILEKIVKLGQRLIPGGN